MSGFEFRVGGCKGFEFGVGGLGFGVWGLGFGEVRGQFWCTWLFAAASSAKMSVVCGQGFGFNIDLSKVPHRI